MSGLASGGPRLGGGGLAGVRRRPDTALQRPLTSYYENSKSCQIIPGVRDGAISLGPCDAHHPALNGAAFFSNLYPHRLCTFFSETYAGIVVGVGARLLPEPRG